MITNCVDFVCSSSLDPDLVFTTSTGLATSDHGGSPHPPPCGPPSPGCPAGARARNQPGVLTKLIFLWSLMHRKFKLSLCKSKYLINTASDFRGDSSQIRGGSLKWEEPDLIYWHLQFLHYQVWRLDLYWQRQRHTLSSTFFGTVYKDHDGSWVKCWQWREGNMIILLPRCLWASSQSCPWRCSRGGSTSLRWLGTYTVTINQEAEGLDIRMQLPLVKFFVGPHKAQENCVSYIHNEENMK